MSVIQLSLSKLLLKLIFKRGMLTINRSRNMNVSFSKKIWIMEIWFMDYGNIINETLFRASLTNNIIILIHILIHVSNSINFKK